MPYFIVFADTGEDSLKSIYLVYDNNGIVVFEGNKVEIGDKIIDKDFKEYEIYFVDDKNAYALADFNGEYVRPKVTKHSKNFFYSNPNIQKTVGIYMTHNDESFVPSDGVSSIYGKGGIHDVAKSLTNAFEGLGYTTYLDETLHIPHNSSAYTRSSVTAKNLLNKNVDALFDIHRDGVSRSVYVKNIDGVERCKVRIVVGQANPNKDANLQFALYLVDVAKEFCPWLFLDIYYAKGTYNQNLTSKGLLFEMGTYLSEKELSQDTVTYLAQVVDKTLFSTIVEDDDNILITDDVDETQTDQLVNNVLDNFDDANQSFWSKYSENIVVFVFVFFAFALFIIYLLNVFEKKRKLKLQQKNNNKLSKK